MPDHTQTVKRDDICAELGLVTKTGNPNVKLVTCIISELQVLPVQKEGRTCFYSRDILPVIRRWFWDSFQGELPKKIYIEGVYHTVRYLPEEESVDIESVA